MAHPQSELTICTLAICPLLPPMQHKALDASCWRKKWLSFVVGKDVKSRVAVCDVEDQRIFSSCVFVEYSKPVVLLDEFFIECLKDGTQCKSTGILLCV